MDCSRSLYFRQPKGFILEPYSILPGVLAFVEDISSRYNALRRTLYWTLFEWNSIDFMNVDSCLKVQGLAGKWLSRIS
jgi:hypothetical protein